MPDKITKTEAEWKQQLSPEQFHVARKAGTEPAFTGKYWDSKEKGTYNCVCCGAPLFESDTKFNSGTGWPLVCADAAPARKPATSTASRTATHGATGPSPVRFRECPLIPIPLPSLKRMLLLQFLHRRPHRTFKSLNLCHKRGSSLGPVPINPDHSIPSHSPRNLQQMLGSSLQILRLRWIRNPDARHPGCPISRILCEKWGFVTHPRLPINLPRQKLRNHLVTRLPKHPLLPLEVVMPARKRHRQQFPRLHKLNLPPVHFLAQRVDHRRLRVLRLERRHHLPHRHRQIHRHRRMQPVGILQPDVPMQHPEIRPRRRLVKRPLQPNRQRQPRQRHPDLLRSLCRAAISSFLCHENCVPNVSMNGSFYRVAGTLMSSNSRGLPCPPQCPSW